MPGQFSTPGAMLRSFFAEWGKFIGKPERKMAARIVCLGVAAALASGCERRRKLVDFGGLSSAFRRAVCLPQSLRNQVLAARPIGLD